MILKNNSKFIKRFSSLCIIALMIFGVFAVATTVSAADSLVKSDFNNTNFAIDIPSGSDFAEEATTNFNIGDFSMGMDIFSNHGNNAKDVNTIMYMKDSSSNSTVIPDVLTDLKKDGPIVEENDKYFVVDTKNSNNGGFFNWDIGNDLNGLWDTVNGIFSSDSDVNVSTSDADVQVSADNGINIVDDNGTSVSLSDKGFFVSDANGDNVSIDTNGVKVTDNNGSGEATEGNISINGDMISSIENSDYALCMESPDNNQVIILAGNNLDLLKSMAETASFK